MKIVWLYLLAINLAAFCLMAADKRRARRHRWRGLDHTLFAAAIFGGSLGSILGMYLCHHITKHWYFVVGMPLILLVQILLGCWIGGVLHG